MAPIRVLIVDDSPSYRGRLVGLLERAGDLHVVGAVANGKLALETLRSTPADVVLLDIDMPVLDGLSTLPLIVRDHPRARVVMVSTLTAHGAEATVRALALGAVDCVLKPDARGAHAAGEIGDSLVAKVRALAERPPAAPAFTPERRPAPSAQARVKLLAIGASAGGPPALHELLLPLRNDLTAPVVLVQHMPPLFTRYFAERLQDVLLVPAHEAGHDEPLDPAHIYVAPGDHHLTVAARDGRLLAQLDREEPENECRPAVDPMLRTVADAVGRNALAVILTGMGHDGLAGAHALVAAGGRVFVQDRATSVVWGMPGAVAEAGLAEKILPLGELSSAIRSAMRNEC